jgi:preprotein translocase subunit YajC
MLISPAYAQAAGGGVGGPDYGLLIAMVGMVAVMYFLMIRPQQKKAKDHRALVAAIKRGDQVVTSGGIIGTVARVRSDTEVDLEIAEGVRVRVVRGTITDVLAKTGHVGKTAANEDDEETDAADTSSKN